MSQRILRSQARRAVVNPMSDSNLNSDSLTARSDADEPPSSTAATVPQSGSPDSGTTSETVAQTMVSDLIQLLKSKHSVEVYEYLAKMDTDTLIQAIQAQRVIPKPLDDSKVDGLVPPSEPEESNSNTVTQAPGPLSCVSESLQSSTNSNTTGGSTDRTVDEPTVSDSVPAEIASEPGEDINQPHTILYFGCNMGTVVGSCIEVIREQSEFAKHSQAPHRVRDLLYKMHNEAGGFRLWPEFMYPAFQHGKKPNQIYVGLSEVPVEMVGGDLNFTSVAHGFRFIGTLHDILDGPLQGVCCDKCCCPDTPYHQAILTHAGFFKSQLETYRPTVAIHVLYLYTMEDDQDTPITADAPAIYRGQVTEAAYKPATGRRGATAMYKALKERFAPQHNFLGQFLASSSYGSQYKSFLIVEAVYSMWNELGLSGSIVVVTFHGQSVVKDDVISASPLGPQRVGTVRNYITTYNKAINAWNQLSHLPPVSLTPAQSRFIKIWSCYTSHSWRNPLPPSNTAGLPLGPAEADAHGIRQAAFIRLLESLGLNLN
ncbi:hypothetical protein K474DRAFT_1710829 [Panus rudis PR-1116 ss-1]|nr:hypothetical protein K474DRAFT_1710829 [Panus rudis PR-1116 ss-1]